MQTGEERLDRKEFERRFHDLQYAQDTRAFFRRFYEVTGASRDAYETFMRDRAAGSDVLELGCGDLPYALVLAEQGARVTGIDLSPVAVEHARERAREAGVDPQRFIAMDAEQMSFASDSFDLVCGTGVLHHLVLESALGEVARVMRPNGSATFIEPLGHNPALRIFRAATGRFRTRDEHPLMIGDLEGARTSFGQVDVAFYHLFGMLAFPFRNRRAFASLLDRLDRADQMLFKRVPYLRRMAWLVVIRLAEPCVQSAR